MYFKLEAQGGRKEEGRHEVQPASLVAVRASTRNTNLSSNIIGTNPKGSPHNTTRHEA